MHAVQNGDSGIDVVVELDVVFAFVGAEEASHALHDPSFERQREREEQGVELGPTKRLSCWIRGSCSDGSTG